MTRPEELSVEKLYEYVVNESQSLLEQTLSFVDSCVPYCEQRPDKAVEIRAQAERFLLIYDIRKKYQDALQQMWGTWNATGYFGRKAREAEERQKLLKLLADYEEWRQLLQKTEEAMIK